MKQVFTTVLLLIAFFVTLVQFFFQNIAIFKSCHILNKKIQLEIYKITFDVVKESSFGEPLLNGKAQNS
jgi:hypothetical protein